LIDSLEDRETLYAFPPGFGDTLRVVCRHGHDLRVSTGRLASIWDHTYGETLYLGG
jgi:hypothetical protein